MLIGSSEAAPWALDGALSSTSKRSAEYAADARSALITITTFCGTLLIPILATSNRSGGTVLFSIVTLPVELRIVPWRSKVVPPLKVSVPAMKEETALWAKVVRERKIQVK